MAGESGDAVVEELVRRKNEQIVLGHNAFSRYQPVGTALYAVYQCWEAAIAYSKNENLFTDRIMYKDEFQNK